MKNETRNWLLLLLLAGIWGSSFILMKRGMYTVAGDLIFSDAQVASLRMTIAGLVLLPFALRALKRLETLKEFLFLAIVGFCGNFFPAFLFTYAETGISSGYAGMLNSFTPLFTMLVGFLFFKNKLTVIQILGLFVGTMGIILLVFAGSGGGNQLHIVGSYWHVWAIIVATFLYGISLNTIKFTLQKFKAIEITSLALFIVLLPAIVSSVQLGTIHTIKSNPFAIEGLGYIAILSIVGTALAVIIFNQLIASSSTLFSSSVTYFIPIVAVFIGLYYEEKINVGQIGAMIFVLFGVFVANYGASIFGKKIATQKGES